MKSESPTDPQTFVHTGAEERKKIEKKITNFPNFWNFLYLILKC